MKLLSLPKWIIATAVATVFWIECELVQLTWLLWYSTFARTRHTYAVYCVLDDLALPIFHFAVDSCVLPLVNVSRCSMALAVGSSSTVISPHKLEAEKKTKTKAKNNESNSHTKCVTLKDLEQLTPTPLVFIVHFVCAKPSVMVDGDHCHRNWKTKLHAMKSSN